MNDYGTIMDSLKLPEYRHVILNPLPIYGLAVAWVALVAAVITRNRMARAIGLSLVIVTSLSILPVISTGEDSYKRVYAMTYQDGQQWLEVHEHRAERAAILYYITAAVAAAALVTSFVYKKLALPLEIATALLAIGALAAGMWVGHAGGKIAHREFRTGPPPSELLHDRHHD